jgi:hypothetical protein
MIESVLEEIDLKRGLILAALTAVAGGAHAVTIFSYDFENSNPTTFSHSGVGVGFIWGNNAAQAHGGSRYIMCDDPNNISDSAAQTPTFTYLNSWSGPMTLSFWHQRGLESTFDGAVLEMSTNGGATWNDILTVGSFVQNGYNGTISSSFGSPIGGRQAWTGNSPGFVNGSNSGYVNTIATINALTPGTQFSLRWRVATDNSVSASGFWVDDATLTVVPEPATMVALGLGAAALLRRRKA